LCVLSAFDKCLQPFGPEQLADVSGLHRTYIGGVERGERNISLMNMARLAGALEVAVVEILDGI